ncbi:hypothetical protein ZEAMMB73_Zm00001d043982 [Zea mays]|uniref:ClpA/ClpB AAA lid domain-containing protein n=1 Tax=Zea mays TaxID=4577 RepID=A0A1D6NGL1_MAIZE|nr:hypothetical protein ZEAMMB73_Zm00001d043982 [Zea mays]
MQSLIKTTMQGLIMTRGFSAHMHQVSLPFAATVFQFDRLGKRQGNRICHGRRFPFLSDVDVLYSCIFGFNNMPLDAVCCQASYLQEINGLRPRGLFFLIMDSVSLGETNALAYFHYNCAIFLIQCCSKIKKWNTCSKGPKLGGGGGKRFQCIGATTLDEYRKHIEKDPALERRFQPVKVPEPTMDETIQILRGLRERYELHHKLRYTDDALIAAAQLSYQYISDRFLPDKAIDLIDEAGSRVRLRHAQLPDEAKELDKELRQISKQKNEAVRGQDFEKNL